MKTRLLLVLVCAALVPLGSARASDSGCPPRSVTFDIEGLAGSDEDSFRAAFGRALAKVCAWWQPPFAGPITVKVESSRGPSMALVLGWRGQRGTMLFRSYTTRMGRSAIVHELVHVYAPNASRLLAEGLAVYAHEHLGGEAAFPNFGGDLYAEAKELAGKADILGLDTIATPTRLEMGSLSEQETYIVAGSFIRYLIETYGFDRFRRLYALTPLIAHRKYAGEPGRWRDIYGKRLEELAKDWKAKIGA